MAIRVTRFDEALFDESVFDGVDARGDNKMFEGRYASSKMGQALGPKKNLLRALNR